MSTDQDMKMGDPVEYVVHEYRDGRVRNIWVPATVVHVDHSQIAIADAAGNRRSISRGFGFLRPLLAQEAV